MDDVALLDWQFRIAKMNLEQLEATVHEMVAPDERPFTLDGETRARLERQALIGNTEAILNRAPSGGGSVPGSGKSATTLDLRAYYEAKAAEAAEAFERADRAEVRAMCERRLAHMWHRQRLRYVSQLSPLKAFIAARETPSD